MALTALSPNVFWRRLKTFKKKRIAATSTISYLNVEWALVANGWDYKEDYKEGVYSITFKPRGNLIFLYPNDGVNAKAKSPIAAYKKAIVEAVTKQVSRHE